MFKKRKIQAYLNGLGEKNAFDTILCDYLDGNIRKRLEDIGLEKIHIHIDWLENNKCVGIDGRCGEYFVEIQIYIDEFYLSYDIDEPDEDTVYPLESSEKMYKTVQDLIRKIRAQDKV